VAAVAQKRLRLLMAFLCLSEAGLTLLGVGSLTSAGIVGEAYQQMALGIGLTGFGLMIGIIEERLSHDDFSDAAGKRVIGGLVVQAPVAALFAGILVASLLGFPGLAGFVGHSLLVVGSYSVNPLVVLLIGASLLMGVYYLFNMYKLVFLGSAEQAGFRDLSPRERGYLLPLAMALLICGLYPRPLIEVVRPAALVLLSMVKP
jgi:NADH-quinone oxidoreductase subunit M